MRRTTFFALLLCLPAAVHGQNMAAMHCGGGMATMMEHKPGQGRMPGMPMPMGGQNHMEMMGPPTPAMILHHKQDLSLTQAQVNRLNALQKEMEPECTKQMEAAMATHRAANKLLDAAKPDFKAFAAGMKQATGYMAEGHVVMAKAAVAARDVLSAEQRQKLAKVMADMHGKREKH